MLSPRVSGVPSFTIYGLSPQRNRRKLLEPIIKLRILGDMCFFTQWVYVLGNTLSKIPSILPRVCFGCPFMNQFANFYLA